MTEKPPITTAKSSRADYAATDAERENTPPCPKHGEGFVCDHEKGVDYADEWD